MSLLFFLVRRGGTTVQELSASDEGLQNWRDRLLAFGPYWSGGVLVALVGILGVYAYRSGKKRLEKAFRQVYEKQINEIKEKKARGELEELPPTKEMEQLQQVFQAHQQLLANVQNDSPLPEAERRALVEELQHHFRIAFQVGDPEAQRQAVVEELQRRLIFIREQWILNDIYRRIDLKVDPDVALPPVPRTRFEKFQTFLISQGLLVNLNRATRLLYTAGLASLMVCLIGVYSPQVGSALSERVLVLDDMRVRLSRDIVREDWKKVQDGWGHPQVELTAADEEVLSQVAARFEQQVCRAEIWHDSSVVRPATYSFRSLVVQDRILGRVARPVWTARQSARLEQLPALSRVDKLQPREKLVAVAYEHALEARTPVTETGRRFLGELKEVVRRGPPNLMNQLRAEVRLFQQPAGGSALGGELTSQIVNLVTGAEHPELADLLHGIDREAVPSLVKRVMDDRSRVVLTELANGVPPKEALRGVSMEHPDRPLVRITEQAELKQTMRTVVGRVPEDKAVLSRLVDHPPGVDLKPEQHVNVPRAKAAVENFHANTRKTLEAWERGRPAAGPVSIDSRRLTMSLTSYADELPAQLAAEMKTPQGKLLTEFEKKFPIRKTASQVAAETNASRIKFLQSRNFNRLQGFHRVGGVLIGREPEKGEVASALTDLRWEMDGPKVRLILGTEDGKEIRSRPYNRNLVYLALAYAADGRTVAVTIADAYPLGEHCILLHPTLVDTPLGRRVIELDHFILDNTRQDKRHDKVVRAFYARNALYRWAWAQRVLAMSQVELDRLGEKLQPEFRTKIMDSIREIKEEARQVVAGANLKLLAEAWATKEQFGDAEYSPWPARKRFYDEKLVRLILDQAARADKLDSFCWNFEAAAQSEWQRLVSSIHEANLQGNDELAEQFLREVFLYWLVEPPSFGLRNIVREKSFPADPSRMVLRDGQDPAGTFDFFLQMVFTSDPYFAGRYADASEEDDDRWWEFRTLSESIQRQVLQGTAGDEKAQTILADVTEFTYLQRLFRAALRGQLGERFEVEKLLALTEATTPAAPSPIRTLRWDMREGPCEVVAAGTWLQVLGLYLPKLDPAWKPVWLDRTTIRNILEEADFVRVLGEWSAKLEQQLAQLPGGDDPRLQWCRETLPKLEQYRLLMAEAAREHRRFKQVTDRLVRQRAKGGNEREPEVWRREWEKELGAFVKWQDDWGQRWEHCEARHPLDPPKTPFLQGKDKVSDCVEALKDLIHLVERTHAAREIRQALGVAKDEQQTLDEWISPLPNLNW
jgi:hypothetical protein